MNLADLLDEIWLVLGEVDGLIVSDDGPGAAAAGVPRPYLELPEITYGEYGPGLDRIPDLGLTVVFGIAANPDTFRRALTYASTDGPTSIPAALVAHAWESCHTLRVEKAEPTTVEPAGQNTQLAYVFHLDLTGAP